MRSRNVGICHSDFELYEGRYIIPVSYPIIPGHEWAGEIAEVGSGVTTLRPGDRVVGECVVNNGDDHFGFSISGADAEYFVAKASWLHRIPDELSFTQGAFVEPFSVAYSASVAAGGIDASDEVAVIGGGPIGLLCAMAAATMGGSVTLIEPQAHRRALGARDRREAGDRSGRGPARRAGGRGDRRPRIRRRDRGRRRSGGDGERVPDRRARRTGRARRHRHRRQRATSRSGSCSRRRSRCAGSSARPGCGRARSASWRRAASTRRRCSRPRSRSAKARPRSTAARDTSRNVKVQIEC